MHVFGTLLGFIALHESVVLPGMSVEVHNHAQLDVLVELGNLFFGLPHLRVLELVLPDPLAVQVHASQTTSLVSIDDAIYVDHWDYFEHKIVPQQFSFKCVA